MVALFFALNSMIIYVLRESQRGILIHNLNSRLFLSIKVMTQMYQKLPVKGL